MKIVRIEEVSHMITLQFENVLNWNEVRATYQNLKFETALNALTEAEAHQLWLPYAIFDNTDDKEAVQLDDDIKTTLVVSREGEFTRGGLEIVDEVEVFRGSENSLALSQTHSKRFQCQYRLNNYPFDTQVSPSLLSLLLSTCFINPHYSLSRFAASGSSQANLTSRQSVFFQRML